MTKFKSILVIDDDDDYLYLVKQSLEKHDLFETVQVMTNANDGVNYIKENCNGEAVANCPDIIFLDNHMPGMDAVAFLDKMNEIGAIENNNLLIYLVSAFASEKDLEMLKKYKIKGFINKPLTAEKVKALLVNA